jgi:hypothetical protein
MERRRIVGSSATPAQSPPVPQQQRRGWRGQALQHPSVVGCMVMLAVLWLALWVALGPLRSQVGV